MLLTTPVERILPKYSLNSTQLRTNGMRPLSGNEAMVFMREQSKAVSAPWEKGELELDVESRMPFLHQRQKVGCGAREVAVTPVDELQLQLDAERERLGGLEFQSVGHASPRVGSPARRSASSVRTGPKMAMRST